MSGNIFALSREDPSWGDTWTGVGPEGLEVLAVGAYTAGGAYNPYPYDYFKYEFPGDDGSVAGDCVIVNLTYSSGPDGSLSGLYLVVNPDGAGGLFNAAFLPAGEGSIDLNITVPVGTSSIVLGIVDDPYIDAYDFYTYGGLRGEYGTLGSFVVPRPTGAVAASEFWTNFVGCTEVAS